MRTDISFVGASTRNRVLVIIGVIALSLWTIDPLQNSLKLGLDLNGGMQLALRVKTDAALLLQTQTAAERPTDSPDHAGERRPAERRQRLSRGCGREAERLKRWKFMFTLHIFQIQGGTASQFNTLAR